MTGIELRQFRYFTAVAEERHFGRAAERLRIAQPGLSRQIKTVERVLGVPLFERRSSGVELTRAGEALLDHARLVIELAERAADTTRLAMHGEKTVIKVGTPAAGIHPAGNDLVRAFRARNPEVEVEIADASDANRLLLVAEGKGIAVPLFPPLAELDIPRVVFRPSAQPASLEYGIAWVNVHASIAVPAFVDMAREMAEASRGTG